jgi:hypothetical protein
MRVESLLRYSLSDWFGGSYGLGLPDFFRGALRAYSEARRILDTYWGWRPRAITLLNEAIREDSTFATAHTLLSAILTNDGRLVEARAAAEMAYRFRNHLTEREQMLVTARYRSAVGHQEAEEAAWHRSHSSQRSTRHSIRLGPKSLPSSPPTPTASSAT